MSNIEVSNWVVGYSQEHQRQFWFNIETKVSSWINPASLVVKKRKLDNDNTDSGYILGGHFIALEDHPLLANYRDHLLEKALVILADELEKFGPLIGDSKTAVSCAKDGFLIGIQGLFARIVWYELLRQIQQQGDVGVMTLDSILPADFEGDAAVKKELVDMGRSEKQVDSIMSLVGTALTSGSRDVLNKRRELIFSNEITRVALVKKGIMYYLQYQKKEHVISETHFKKLLGFYQENTDKYSHDQDPLFLRRLFCVLSRYETLSGKSEGYQMAFPDVGFKYLRDTWGVDTECFASPLNCYNSRFCSIARDTDQFFGSLGNFFCYEGEVTQRYRSAGAGNITRGGSFEANPPFVEAVMNEMADRIFFLLSKYPSAPFSFIVIVPGWSDCRGVIDMTNSVFTRPHVGYRLVLEKKKHDYRPGMQHRSAHTHQPSNVDTFVFFLQNEAGAARWPVTLEQADRLRELLEEDCFWHFSHVKLHHGTNGWKVCPQTHEVISNPEPVNFDDRSNKEQTRLAKLFLSYHVSKYTCANEPHLPAVFKTDCHILPVSRSLRVIHAQSRYVQDMFLRGDYPCHASCASLSKEERNLSDPFSLCQACPDGKPIGLHGYVESEKFWLRNVPNDTSILILGSGAWYNLHKGILNSTHAYLEMLTTIAPLVGKFIEQTHAHVYWIGL
eukprot:gene33528-40563_t